MLPDFWAMHPDAMRARADVSPPSVTGIACMSIVGPVQKEAHPTAASWAAVRAFIAAGAADPSVKGFAFFADSGGGSVAGMQSAAYALRASGKPSMMIVGDGAACGSAVFYFGSACSLGIWAAPLSMVGGIGVYIPTDTDPADPAAVSKLTPAKHLPGTDPRAQASAQRAADAIAVVMLTDMAAWAGLPGPEAAAAHFGAGEMLVAADAPPGMIAGLAMDPPLHLFNPAGLAPAIPGGAPMPGADARAEVEGLAPEALAEPVAEMDEAEDAPDYAAMSPEERAALKEKLRAELAALEAADAPPAAAVPDPEARAAAAAAFSRSLVDRNLALPSARAQWERDYMANPDAAVVKAAGLKPALHTAPKGDARREPAPAPVKDQAGAVKAAQALADADFGGDYVKGRSALIKNNPALAVFFGG